MTPTGLAALQGKSWDAALFPNPASGLLSLSSSRASESLHISIRDVSGRSLLEKDLTTTGFMANLELKLANGVYFATITGSHNEKVIKKLLIAK